MASRSLTQSEADDLIAMEKHRTTSDPYNFPARGQSLHIPLTSHDKREEFILTVNRQVIEISKVTYLSRARVSIVLLRLDINGGAHRNPDGAEVPCPHIHVYREGYDDKWAYPIDDSDFSSIDNMLATLSDFMKYCNVTSTPSVRGVLPI